MNAGDTIKIVRPDASYDSHLWMLISDPDASDQCVLVNFTSWRHDKDQACILDKGDHPYIRHKTCVNYRQCKVCSISEIRELMTFANVTSDAPLSEAVLKRIRDAVLDSLMPMDAVAILADQGLIDLDN